MRVERAQNTLLLLVLLCSTVRLTPCRRFTECANHSAAWLLVVHTNSDKEYVPHSLSLFYPPPTRVNCELTARLATRSERDLIVNPQASPPPRPRPSPPVSPACVLLSHTKAPCFWLTCGRSGTLFFFYIAGSWRRHGDGRSVRWCALTHTVRNSARGSGVRRKKRSREFLPFTRRRRSTIIRMPPSLPLLTLPL